MELLIFTLLLGLSLAHFTFIFNHTDFVVEYATLLGHADTVKAAEYEEWKEKNDIEYGYPMFLRETHNCFYTRLLGCPFCLITFLSIPLSLFSASFWFPFVAFAAASIGSVVYLITKLLHKKISS